MNKISEMLVEVWIFSFQENAFENKCLENGGQFVSASSVKPIVSELFPRGPIGNSAALVQVVAWCRTAAEPFPKPMTSWHHLCKYVTTITAATTTATINQYRLA